MYIHSVIKMKKIESSIFGWFFLSSLAFFKFLPVMIKDKEKDLLLFQQNLFCVYWSEVGKIFTSISEISGILLSLKCFDSIATKNMF